MDSYALRAVMEKAKKHRRPSARNWIPFILAAVLFHLILIFSVKPSYLSFLARRVSTEPPSISRGPFSPDAIITLPVTVEEPQRESRPRASEEAEEIPEKEPPKESEAGGGFDVPSIEKVIGEGAVPLPDRGGSRRLVLPPSPVEIVWPDVRGLERCVGLSIELRIHVDERGKVDGIEPAGSGYPQECVDAALRAAGRMVFSPGTVDGEPSAMWTRVRLDFRPRRQNK